MDQTTEKTEASPEAMQKLTRALDNLTDAIREVSWILLDRWKWQPVDHPTKSGGRAAETIKQPASTRPATE